MTELLSHSLEAVAGVEPAVRLALESWATGRRALIHRGEDETDEARRDEARDYVVPSPLMPHLMFEWLVARARARWPLRWNRRN